MLHSLSFPVASSPVSHVSSSSDSATTKSPSPATRFISVYLPCESDRDIDCHVALVNASTAMRDCSSESETRRRIEPSDSRQLTPLKPLGCLADQKELDPIRVEQAEARTGPRLHTSRAQIGHDLHRAKRTHSSATPRSNLVRLGSPTYISSDTFTCTALMSASMHPTSVSRLPSPDPRIPSSSAVSSQHGCLTHACTPSRPPCPTPSPPHSS